MARYHLTQDGPVPFTPEEESEWDARDSAPHVPVVPNVISRFQGMAVLYQMGMIEQLEQLVASNGFDPLLRIAWRDTTQWERNSTYLIALATAFNISSAQVDELFIRAAQINI